MRTRRLAWPACSAALCGLASLGLAHADVVTTQSAIGLSGEYTSDPLLQYSNAVAAESLAAFATLPLTYTSGAQTFDLTPSVRASLSHGNIAALSSYQYLDGDWRISRERSALTLSGLWHHDSTLYQPFEEAAVQGRDLLRRETSANATWQYLLSERRDVQISAAWDKVAYSNTAITALSSYSYEQGSASYDFQYSERWKWTAAAGEGQYLLSGGSYHSDTSFIQSTFAGTLSELWTLSLQGGYNYQKAGTIEPVYQVVTGPNGQPMLEVVDVTLHSQKGGGSYSASLVRHGERAEIDLTASQSVQPSGLGALVTDQDFSAKVQYPWSERLTISGTVHAARLTNSLRQVIPGGQRVEDVDLSLTWKWTEKLNLQLMTSYLEASSGSIDSTGRNLTIYLNLLRQFGITRL